MIATTTKQSTHSPATAAFAPLSQRCRRTPRCTSHTWPCSSGPGCPSWPQGSAACTDKSHKSARNASAPIKKIKKKEGKKVRRVKYRNNQHSTWRQVWNHSFKLLFFFPFKLVYISVLEGFTIYVGV